MSPEPSAVEVRIARRIAGGLDLDVAFAMGAERAIVFGPSGSGKTSLLRAVAGLDRPDAGVVAVGGTRWFDSASRVNLPLRARRVGMIFQDDLLFPHLSVEGNIRFGLSRETRNASLRRAAEVAALCGVTHLMQRHPATLSGGERQRVGLARALAPRPRLLLCDEPVSALDLDARFVMVDLLRAIHEAERMPLLYVTHSPAEAIALGTSLLRMEAGRITDRGPPLDVLARRSSHAAASRLDDVRNVHRGIVLQHQRDRSETIVELVGGPSLVVPHLDRNPGDAVSVVVRADDILLARGPIAGLSARNVIPATVQRVVRHGGDAEVILQTGRVLWIVSLVGSAVEALGLAEGAEAHMILKARSCHVAAVGPEVG